MLRNGTLLASDAGNQPNAGLSFSSPVGAAATTPAQAQLALDANPLNGFGLLPSVGGAAGALTGSAIGAGISSGLSQVLGKFTAPLKGYLEDAALVVLGIVVVIVGLVMLARAGKNNAPAAPAPSPSKTEGAGEEAAEAAAV